VQISRRSGKIMIIFIYGQNTFNSQQKLQELKAKFIKDIDSGGDSIKVLDGASTSVQDISQALGSSSLFSSKRLIIVRDIVTNKDKTIFKNLRDYLKKNEEANNDNIIIFIDEHSGEKMGRNVLWQYLLKQQFVQNFPALNVSQVNQWIGQRAEKHGAILSSTQIAKISGTFASNLWQIDNELNKIIHYKRGLNKDLSKDEKITIADEDLDNMSSGKVDKNIFALTDAIGNKNKRLALVLLEQEMEAGMAETYLLHMIVRQFRILMQVRQGLDSGLAQARIAAEIKLHPYVVQKSLQQARGFSLEFLKNIFLKLIELDKGLKTGQAEFKVSLGLLIAKL